jgi:branched-chain amino acid transport system substrate-binding protein
MSPLTAGTPGSVSSSARTRRRLFPAVGLAAALALASSASLASARPLAGSTANAPADVLIGAPMPLSGAGAAFGTPYLKSLQMTVDAINARGGIKSLGGAKLRLVTADDQGDPARDVQLLNEMASQKVSAFAGPLLSATVIPSVSTFTRLQIPFVGPQLDNAVTDQGSKYVFRVANRATGWAANVYQFLRAQKLTPKIKSIGIVGINVPPGTSTTDVVAASAKKLGWQVTKIDYDQRTTLDFAPLVSRLASADVDLIVGYQNPNDSILFAKAIGAQSWRPGLGFVWVIGGQQLPSFMTSVGSVANNWLVANYVGPIAKQRGASAPLRKLAAQFQAETQAEMTAIAGGGPAIMTVIAAGIQNAKSRDPQKVRDAIAKIRWKSATDAPFPYYSFAGGVRFYSNGDNILFRPTFTQLNATKGQTAVYPPNLATGKLVLPAR